MFDIFKYEFDREHNSIEIGGEAMIFHSHHHITNIQRTILDADYIDSRPFIIGSAVQSAHNQLSNLCANLNSINDKKQMAEEVYKAFGYGLIDLTDMNEMGLNFFLQNLFSQKLGK